MDPWFFAHPKIPVIFQRKFGEVLHMVSDGDEVDRKVG